MAKALIIRFLGLFALWCALFGVSKWAEVITHASQSHETAKLNPVHPHSHHGTTNWDRKLLATELEETQSSEKKTTKSLSLEGCLIPSEMQEFLPEQTHFKELEEFSCNNPSRPLYLWQAVFRI